jgi:hypothetical protein
MNLSDQVISLEHAKRLKEIGVKQESLFFYQLDNEYYGHSKSNETKITYGKDIYISLSNPNRYSYYSAFTVSELGEIIFEKCYEKLEQIGYLEITTEVIDRFDGKSYRLTNNKTDNMIGDKKEADARAQMLIIFIEIGLLD